MFKRLSLSTLVIPVVLLVVIGCAEKKLEPQADTIRICDDHGCADRPKDYASFNPESAVSSEDEAKIIALEDLAVSDPAAAYDLALRYFRGDGIRQNTYQSIKWMRDAAERGFLDAQKALGRLYLTGLGEMGADPGEAEKWLSITASRGDKEAAKLLKEATVARQYKQDEYEYYRKWRPLVNNYWYSGYSYHWRWGGGRWVVIY